MVSSITKDNKEHVVNDIKRSSELEKGSHRTRQALGTLDHGVSGIPDDLVEWRASGKWPLCASVPVSPCIGTDRETTPHTAHHAGKHP